MDILMPDSADLSIWLTDIVLLALAYWVGRIHGAYILGDMYRKSLTTLLDEVKTMRRKMERMNDLYIMQREDKH